MKGKVYYPLGDQIGSIELLDYMGSDQTIAEAAWVSTTGLKKRSPVPQLLDYLMRHGHMSPYEMCEVKFRMTIPLAVMAQVATHRTASRNQISARYVELPQENYQPLLWRAGSTGHNKQWSTEQGIQKTEEADRIYAELVEQAHKAQGQLLELGVAPELARLAHLHSQYTSLVWKIDLRNLMNFLSQRTSPHAQAEVRAYAEVMEEIASELFPAAIAAWRNHQKHAVTFSEDESKVLAQMLAGKSLEEALSESGLRESRQAEFKEKLVKLESKGAER